eukprot:Transcript_12858.p2 GENE.Transcript_12858~~Transcript_12858.p2  ORF type:complete len:341 (+),score=125.05 Transcript_12858:702-1724(+)
MRSMLAAWQPDQKAALLRPHGVTTLPPPPFNGSIGAEAPPSHDVAAPPAHPDAPSVLRWLSARHCVHYSHARSKTHLLMQVGGEAAAFVHVPPQLRASFHEAYVADGRPKYLCELRDKRFRFYADIDFEDAEPLSAASHLALARALQTVLASPEHAACLLPHADATVIVSAARPTPLASSARPLAEDQTFGMKNKKGKQAQKAARQVQGDGPSDGSGGGGGYRSGVHLHLPGSLIDGEQALALRQALVRALADVAPPALPALGPCWAEAVDGGVYNEGCGLRMLGSLKVKRGAQVGDGRPYRVVAVVNPDGTPMDEAALAAYVADAPRVLSDVSLHPRAD